MAKPTKPELYRFELPFERALVWTCCTNADFYEKLGRRIEIEGLSDDGVDEGAFIRRAPAKLALQAAAAIYARDHRGPSSVVEVTQHLSSEAWAGRITYQEIEAVRAMLSAVAADPSRLTVEKISAELIPRLRYEAYAQAIIRCHNEHAVNDPTELARAAEDLAEAARIGTDGAASDIETVVDVLDDIKAVRTEWFSPGRLALGDLSLMVGDPEVGKGLVCIAAAAAVTRGWPFLGGRPREPARVMLLSTEDSPERTLKPRLVAAGGDAELALIQKIKRRGETRLPVFCPEELAAVERVVVDRGVRLVVIDPVIDFIPDRPDADTQRGIRRVLLLLHEFARRTGTVVIAIVHLNKTTASGKLLYRIIGSVAQAAVARSVLAVAKDPAGSERRVLAVAKLNDGIKARSIYFDILSDYPTVDGQEISTARIEWGDECDVKADDLVEPPESKKKDGPIDQAISFLKQALAGGPRIASEVIDEALNGELFSKHTLLNAKRRLGVVAKRLPGQKVEWEWSMPDVQTEKRVEPDGQAS